MIGIMGSDCRTDRYSVPDETDMKKTKVARTLIFSRFDRGVKKKQLELNKSGTRTISGNIIRIRSSDWVVYSTV